MAFFTKPDSTPLSALAPLTQDRIKAVMDSQGMRYGVDADGDIGGFWGDHVFFILQVGHSGEYLATRGRWNRKVGVDQLAAVTTAVNDWNANTLWPKVFVRVEDDVLGVYGEHTVDYQHGLTDDQLNQHLACGIQTTLSFFDQLDQAYPAEVAAAKAELEADS